MPDSPKQKPILLIMTKPSYGGNRQHEELMATIEESSHDNVADALVAVIKEMGKQCSPTDWIIVSAVTIGDQRDPIQVPRIIRRMSR